MLNARWVIQGERRRERGQAKVGWKSGNCWEASPRGGCIQRGLKTEFKVARELGGQGAFLVQENLSRRAKRYEFTVCLGDDEEAGMAWPCRDGSSRLTQEEKISGAELFLAG